MLNRVMCGKRTGHERKEMKLRELDMVLSEFIGSFIKVLAYYCHVLELSANSFLDRIRSDLPGILSSILTD
jgi:hypothetical protein